MSSVSNDLIPGVSWNGFPPLPMKFDFSPFPATIPVVDLSQFLNPATKQQFVDDVLKAMREVGFFAVVNTGMDEEALIKAYDASRTFFEADQKYKDEICKPELNGQRGYVPSEVAQEATRKDYKEFVHIGRKNNLWPAWMDLQSPMEKLIEGLDQHSEILQRAFAMAIGEEEDFLIKTTKEGECLLRLLHYPRTDDPNAVGASKHTDIDLFTILPMATEDGLQVWHNEEWIDVKVPPGAFIVNVGDKLQNLTNGLFKSSVHQVIVKPNVERYSIVYFVHPRDDDSVGPTPNAVALTGGVTGYPEATSLELLAVRLREIALADPNLKKFERECGVRERISALVESGAASEPVKLTHSLLMKNYEN